MSSIAEQISRSLVRGSLHDAAKVHPVSATASRWLDADREFNAWFLANVKHTPDDEAVLQVVSAYGEDQAGIEQAWEQYRADFDAAAFAATLERSIARMAEVQAGFRG
jgi:hypothetical protein